MFQLDTKILGLIAKACKNKKHIKLTVGVIMNSEKAIKVFGENGVEIENNNDIYEIGSISKTFTASLMTKYINEDKMSLDDSISKYIEGLDGYYPNLRRLVTHTSGYSGILTA